MKTSYPTIRLPNIDKNTRPIFYDVESHIAAGHHYYGEDESNSVHEITHGINGVLRIKNRCAAFYCLDDIAFLLKDTKSVRILHAHQFIPKSLRGSGFEHYLNFQMKDWDAQPLYLFDEWSAYINGSTSVIKALQLGVFETTMRKDGLKQTTMLRMMEMAAYTSAIIGAIIKYEPTYDIHPVIELWNYQFSRLESLLVANEEIKHRRVYDKEPREYLDKFLNSNLSIYLHKYEVTDES